MARHAAGTCCAAEAKAPTVKPRWKVRVVPYQAVCATRTAHSSSCQNGLSRFRRAIHDRAQGAAAQEPNVREVVSVIGAKLATYLERQGGWLLDRGMWSTPLRLGAHQIPI